MVFLVLGRFFSFITLNISCHSLLTYRISIEKSADYLLRVPLYVICRVSLVAFNASSLSLIFVSLIAMYLGVFLLGFILPGTLFLDFVDYFLSHVREVFSYYLVKYFIRSFLSSPSGTPIMWMLVCLMLSQRSLRQSSFFSFFSLYSVLWQWFPPFCPTSHLSILLPLLFYCCFLLLHCSSLFVL